MPRLNLTLKVACLKVDKLTRGLSFSFLPFPFHKCKLRRVGSFLWAMVGKLVLYKHRSTETFINFSLKLKDLCRVKRKMYWNRPKSYSASESLLSVWALVLDLSQRQPKRCDFWHFHETANLMLMLVDNSWHWGDTGLPCPGAQQELNYGIQWLALTHYL